MIEFQAFVDGGQCGGVKFACVSHEIDGAEIVALDRLHRAIARRPLDACASEVSPMFILALVAAGHAKVRLDAESEALFVEAPEELSGRRYVGQSPTRFDIRVLVEARKRRIK